MPNESYGILIPGNRIHFFVSRHPTEECMSCQIINFSFSLERGTTAATNSVKYKKEIWPAELKNSSA